ncbi:MAG: ribonuclease Z [Flavobacteriia bacterium]|nr:ribonuclease Z [Flavobacteriia bacterium]
MRFEVTILGSGAALPTSLRNPSAQYVWCNDRHILIDCGEGTQNQLRKNGISLQKITHILISHLHGDHFFGLVGLLSSMHLLGRNQGITVYGPEGLEQIIRLQLEIGGASIGFGIDFVTLDGKTPQLLFEDNRIEILTFPLKHRVPTNGFRINEKPFARQLDGDKYKREKQSLVHIPALKRGEDVTLEDGTVLRSSEYTFAPRKHRSYAYCSDTTYQEVIVPFIQGVDVLYHEATFLDNMADRAVATFHSTAKQAAQIAQQAQVGQLLLGHLSARYEDGNAHAAEAKMVFENTMVVEDGMVIVL